MKLLFYLVLFCLVSFGFFETSNAQVTISTMNNPASFFVDQLVGSGVTYSNATFSNTGAAYASTSSSNYGLFNNASSVIGISNGIILSTGNVLGAPGPNSLADMSTVNVRGGDGTLNSIISPTYDAMGLEFDFVPESNVITFRYVFASEEYNEFVGDIYNDVFGFFVTGGPEAYSNKNIAIVPGTGTTPVAINSVNNGYGAAGSTGGGCTNCSYYRDNGVSAYNLQYDGFTTVLTATCSVTPCAVYHMKIIIADVSDYVYDSGVFLESGSFTSPSINQIDVAYSNPLAGGNAAMVEGCSNGQITFGLTSPTPFNRNIPFAIAGSATFGTDYYTIPDISGTWSAPNNYFVTIPAGQSTTTLTIVPINEGTVESSENIDFTIQTNLCGTPVVQNGSLNILDNSTPFSSTITADQTICLGNNATIGLNINGGQNPISYTWNPTGYTTGTITVNPPANQTYTVTATDACGSTTTGTTTVNVNNIPTVVPFPTSETFCSGSTTNIALSSAVTGATFNWTVNAGANISGASSGSDITISQTLINSGTTQESVTYTVTPSANGCSGPPTDITIYVNPSPTATATTTPVTTCSGTPDGSITINATGGTAPLNYSLDGGATGTNNIFSNLGIGGHTAIITDAAGCQFTLSNIDIAGNTGISITSITPIDVNCYGENSGSLTITAPGATQYSINNGTDWFPTNTFNSLTAGTYNVVVSDAGNCQDAQSITISSPSIIVIDSTVTNMLCTVLGDATLSVNGGVTPYSYTWFDSTTLPSHNNLTNGTYLVTVSDSHSCTVITSVIVGYDDGNLSLQNNISNISCHGDSTGNISLIVQNGTSPFVATWSGITNTSLTLSGLGAGTYDVTVTDINGCTVNSSINIVEPSQISLDSSVINHTCGTLGSITITPSGGTPGYLYYWNTPGSTAMLNNLPAGIYTVTVTDALNCSATTNAEVGLITTSGIGQSTITNVQCNGESNGAATITITNGIAPFSCIWQHDVTNTTNTASNLSAGNYLVTVTDTYGACVVPLSIEITQPSTLTISPIITHITCNNLNNGVIVANASGGTIPYQYNWSNNLTTASLTNLPEGDYDLTITDGNNCIDSVLNINITNPTALTISTSFINPTFFNSTDGAATVYTNGGTLPYSYSWSTGQTTQIITSIGNGLYIVTVTDFNNCNEIDTILIDVPELPVEIPTVITPNGDGKNDDFEITNILGYSDISVEIFNRWGDKIFSFTGSGLEYTTSSNRWNGTRKGKDLPMGSYIFIIKLNNGREPVTGVVSIIR
ncbi:MAG: choice-of-anchor L domain-containing protein [Bacteroidia bacterium]|nr:choice-of-anchor L domain-containing protein [Bacteroidia bacterium]